MAVGGRRVIPVGCTEAYKRCSSSRTWLCCCSPGCLSPSSSGTFRSAFWGAPVLSPDLELFGVLKPTGAGLFLEYDGHYRHHEALGLVADERKTEALLCFAPLGSVVLRMAEGQAELRGDCC